MVQFIMFLCSCIPCKLPFGSWNLIRFILDPFAKVQVVVCSFIRRRLISGCLSFCGVSSCWYSIPRSFHSFWYPNSIISSSFINWNIFINEMLWFIYYLETPWYSSYWKGKINTCFLLYIYYLCWGIIHIPYTSPIKSTQQNVILVYS